MKIANINIAEWNWCMSAIFSDGREVGKDENEKEYIEDVRIRGLSNQGIWISKLNHFLACFLVVLFLVAFFFPFPFVDFFALLGAAFFAGDAT